MVCFRFRKSKSFTWHQALTLILNLIALGFERGDDDGAGIPIVVVVQYGGLCVVVVIIWRFGLHSVGTVVAGTVRVWWIMDSHATDDILPLWRWAKEGNKNVTEINSNDYKNIWNCYG